MKRTNLYLDERQTATLDIRARAAGVSRAELVRRLIDQSLDAEEESVARDLDAIAASFGVLRASVDSDTPAQGSDSGDDRGAADDGWATWRSGADARAEHLERLRRA